MKYIISLFVLLSVVACQSDNNTSSNNDIKLFADYYVRYLENEQELKAEATFKRGLNAEKAKKVDLEGELSLFGKQLAPVMLNKSIFRYQLQKEMPFRPSFDFKLVEDAGRTTNHTIQLSTIGKFSLENGVASKKDGFQLHWDGAALLKNERLLVLITDKNNKAHSISIPGPTSIQSATIKGLDLQPLATGNGYIYLVKKQQNKETQGNIVISSLAEYYSDRILVAIED